MTSPHDSAADDALQGVQALQPLHAAMETAAQSSQVPTDTLRKPLQRHVRAIGSVLPAELLASVMQEAEHLERLALPGAVRGLDDSPPLRNAVIHAVLEFYCPQRPHEYAAARRTDITRATPGRGTAPVGTPAALTTWPADPQPPGRGPGVDVTDDGVEPHPARPSRPGRRTFHRASDEAAGAAAFVAVVGDLLALYVAGYLVDRLIGSTNHRAASGRYRTGAVGTITEAGQTALARWRASQPPRPDPAA